MTWHRISGENAGNVFHDSERLGICIAGLVSPEHKRKVDAVVGTSISCPPYRLARQQR